MGLFNIFNKLDTKNNNGLNLIYDGKTKNLLYAYNKKNGKIEGLLQVFYSVEESSRNPNYKRNNVGFVNKEFVFINGLINGDFKEYDSKGNLLYYIENIKSSSFNFILKFSCRNFYENKKLSINDEYHINGFLFRYYSDGSFSKAKLIDNNNLFWEKYYQNGQIIYDSVEKKYYYANGQLKKDLKSGKEYYEDGAIKKMKNGEGFYNNGQLKKNLKSGEEFYENGQLKKNLKSGEEYCENGKLKYDIKGGREYHDNGNIKIKNDNGAKYLLSKKLNPDYLKDNLTFDIFLNNDAIILDKRIYEYYKNIFIYNEDGQLINIEQIVKLYDQDDDIKRQETEWLKDRENSSDNFFDEMLRPHYFWRISNTEYSEPILINKSCFTVVVKYYFYKNPFTPNDIKNKKIIHLIPFNGLFENLYYKDGVSIDVINFS
jgi:hypothetical protein